MALLLLFASAYACVPFFANVSAHNNLLAPVLLDSECTNRSEPDFENPIACAELEPLTVYPSVDGRIPSERPARLLWRHASEPTIQVKRVVDSNGCENIYRKEFLFQNLSVDLRAEFMNDTFVNEQVDGNPLPLPIPQSALSYTDGSNITLTLNGTFYFQYAFYNLTSHWSCPAPGFCGCTQQRSSGYFNITRNVSGNLSYEVEGGSVLHFLYKPVLGEQWAGNSVFEDAVFSKRKFCNYTLALNNGTIESAALYTFNITNDSLDVWRIVSTAGNSSPGWVEMRERSTPTPIEFYPEAFSLINVFTKEYSAQGRHNITISFQDHFGSQFSQRFELVSRHLTMDGSLGEDGSSNISDRDLYRPSAKAEDSTFTPLLAGLSLVGLALFLIIFLKR
ncbi:MAG: hypothetical protein WC488_02225 [Candidatus Micrarchaeia archaeon]